MSKYGYRFRDTNITNSNSLVIPLTTTKRRKYIPIGFIDNSCIATNALSVIYDCETWLFSIISSKIHVVWIKTVCGKFRTHYRYSSTLGYNTFPFPAITDNRKQELTNCAFNIIEEREKHSDKTLAELYDPDKMPDSLKEAHRQNDLAVERCYRNNPFESDEERLKYLFNLYEKMIKEEQSIEHYFKWNYNA